MNSHVSLLSRPLGPNFCLDIDQSILTVILSETKINDCSRINENVIESIKSIKIDTDIMKTQYNYKWSQLEEVTISKEQDDRYHPQDIQSGLFSEAPNLRIITFHGYDPLDFPVNFFNGMSTLDTISFLPIVEVRPLTKRSHTDIQFSPKDFAAKYPEVSKKLKKLVIHFDIPVLNKNELEGFPNLETVVFLNVGNIQPGAFNLNKKLKSIKIRNQPKISPWLEQTLISKRNQNKQFKYLYTTNDSNGEIVCPNENDKNCYEYKDLNELFYPSAYTGIYTVFPYFQKCHFLSQNLKAALQKKSIPFKNITFKGVESNGQIPPENIFTSEYPTIIKNALSIPAYCGDHKLAEFVMSNTEWYTSDSINNSLNIAVQKGNSKVVEVILKSNIVTPQNLNKYLNVATGSYFFSTSASGSVFSGMDFTPLTGYYREDKKIAELLLSYGADPNSRIEIEKNFFFFPLQYASYEVSELLLKAKADPDIKYKLTNGEPELTSFLIQTVKRCDLRFLNYLFNYSNFSKTINLNQGTVNSALSISKELCSTSVTDLLLKNGAKD